MFEAFVPSITLPAGKESRRAGGGIGIKCGDEVMLADGFEGGEPTNGLKDWLEKNGVSTVKTAVLTHVHYDHYHGLMEIEDDSRFHIETVLMYDPLTLKHGCDGSENGQALQDDIDRAYKFIRYMQARGTKVKWIDKGSTVKCGDTTWKVYRNQPRRFTADDDGNAYAFVNDGSLVLCSPEVPLLFGGDGCIDLEDAIAYFHQIIIAMYVQHHGNCCPESDAKAAKEAGVILMWETNVERKGPGTTGFTMYGSRRAVQQGIPVWMQNQPIYITAANGKIVFKQGSKIVTANIPYQGFQTGWGKDTKGWFYTLSDGRRAIGWIKVGWSKPQSKDGRDWFFMDEDGYMVKGFQKCPWSQGTDTFYFDENGVMQTGWKHIGGRWYYFDPKTGAMKTGWLYDNGSWFYLGADGKMVTGWVEYKGRKCYLEPKSDKNHVQGTCYVNRTAVIDGKTYRFDKNGYATEEKGGGASINRSKKIIDISEFQGDVNWAKASTEVGAVYIRCGLRGALKETAPVDYKLIRYDKKWARNLSAVQTYGIPFSAYYFPTAINDAEALEGAKWFYEVVKNLDLAFPPALDSENVWGKNKEAGRANGLSKSERTRLLKIVTDYFNARGMNIGIYASASWLNSKIDMSAFPQCVRDCTWVADSTGAVDYKGYYWLHQYGKGACAGFSDDIDLNRITGTIPPARINAAPAVQKTESPIDVAISIAESYLGTHEGANNKTIFGDTMHKVQPSNMDANAPWCDAFVDFVILKTCEHFGKGAETARMVLCGDFDDYTYNSVALYKKAGRWFKTPVRGDQIFFGGNGHTGIVESVNGGTVHTIEGNKGDEVRRCSYSIHSPSIIGYGRPRYYLLTGKITAADMPLVKKGSKGDAVKKLQEMLIAKGYSCGKYGADGDFGADTDSAVRKYQKDHGLTVDGEVGEKTWGSLFA